MLPMGQQARLGGDTLSRFLVHLAPRALIVQVLDTTAGPNRLVLERPGGPSDNHSEEIAGG